MSEIKPGDRVTPENVASLPDHTIVEWRHDGSPHTAEKIEDDLWYSPRNGVLFDHEIADPDGSLVTIASLGPPNPGAPECPGRVPKEQG